MSAAKTEKERLRLLMLAKKKRKPKEKKAKTAEKRADEVQEEFARQAPMGPGAMQYHVGAVVERIRKSGQGLL